jgi:signal transduction histidine kinase
VAGLTGAWVALTAIAYFRLQGLEGWHCNSTIWARYLIGLPGAVLTALGLRTQAQNEVILSSGRRIYGMLQVAGFSMLAYALVGGLLGPPASFFPSNVLNQTIIESTTGVPIEVFRSLTGLFFAASMIRALEVFDIEVDRLIETMEVETIRAAERERIGQEIHDGAMQGIYSISLILESVQKRTDGDSVLIDRLKQARQVLEMVISDLRRYMLSLRAHPPEGTLVEELERLIALPRFSSLVDVRLEVRDEPKVTPKQAEHLLSLTQEALSNVVRHAEASQVTIGLRRVNRHFVLEIGDDGRGFDQTQVTPGFGLQAMRDNVCMLSADLRIDTAPGNGTTLIVELSEEVAS